MLESELSVYHKMVSNFQSKTLKINNKIKYSKLVTAVRNERTPRRHNLKGLMKKKWSRRLYVSACHEYAMHALRICTSRVSNRICTSRVSNMHFACFEYVKRFAKTQMKRHNIQKRRSNIYYEFCPRYNSIGFLACKLKFSI